MKPEINQIPKRIKELREILEISAVDMAKSINVPISDYMKYESGEADIPISILYEIAEKLNTDCTVLMTGDSPKMDKYTVVRSGNGVKINRYDGYDFESLAYNFKDRKMNPMLVVLEKKDDEPALVSHPGQEFNFVLEGEVKVTVGSNSFNLKKGDSIYFDPGVLHGQAAITDVTKFLTVIL